MTGSRLTGLEFRWFGQGQLLASRYHRGAAIDLELSVAALLADISADVRAASDGPTSLRRVADRFALDADAIQTEGAQSSPSLPRRDTERQIRALRSLAAAFKAAATETAA
jgi:hypothetical protein